MFRVVQALNIDQLYGKYDAVSKEWSSGVLARLFRACATARTKPQWSDTEGGSLSLDRTASFVDDRLTEERLRQVDGHKSADSVPVSVHVVSVSCVNSWFLSDGWG